MTEELKRCPFCAGEAKLYSSECCGYGGRVCVKCAQCAAQGESFKWLTFYDCESEKERGKAIDAWNNRPLEEELQDELKIVQTKP